MASKNETIVTGNIFKKLIDIENDLWEKKSFWTKASDVEFDDGLSAEEKLGNLKFVSLTAEQYNSLPMKDNNTIYFVLGNRNT